MGWKANLLLITLALGAAAFAAWIITVPILAFLGAKAALGSRAARTGPRGSRWNLSARVLAGWGLTSLGTFLSLGLGHFSPLLISVLGAGLLLLPRIRTASSRGLSPVPSSITLRATFPLLFRAVAEVKVASSDITRALAGAEGWLVLDLRAQRAFVVFSAFSLGSRGAERRLSASMGKVNRLLSRAGAHLLPLEASEAASLFAQDLEERTTDGARLLPFISAAPVDLLVVKSRGGQVRAAGAYLSEPGAAPKLPSAGRRLPEVVSLWELLEAVKRKGGWRAPDPYASFLAAAWASRREGIGESLTSNGPADGESVTVSSHASPAVKLSRAQLRAVIGIYFAGRGEPRSAAV
jgi:hypothetical protein